MTSKLNEKGYFLMESLIALSLVSMLLLVYAPFLDSMIQKLETEKREVEMCRLLYDGARKGEDSEETIASGRWVFHQTTRLTGPQKGIWVEHGKTNTQKQIFMLSVQID